MSPACARYSSIIRPTGSKVESNVTEAIFTPIKNDATRVAALISGDIDMMEPVPLQDIDKLKAAPALNVLQGPELRTIFLGMDQARDELLFSNIEGQEPVQGQARAPGVLPGDRHRGDRKTASCAARRRRPT